MAVSAIDSACFFQSKGRRDRYECVEGRSLFWEKGDRYECVEGRSLFWEKGDRTVNRKIYGDRSLNKI